MIVLFLTLACHEPATTDDTEAETGGTGETGADTAIPGEPLLLESISPGSGSVLGGDAVILDGAGFDAETLVWFGDLPALVLTESESSLKVASPAADATGTVAVRVDRGDRSASLEDAWTYYADAGGETIGVLFSSHVEDVSHPEGFSGYTYGLSFYYWFLPSKDVEPWTWLGPNALETCGPAPDATKYGVEGGPPWVAATMAGDDYRVPLHTFGPAYYLDEFATNLDTLEGDAVTLSWLASALTGEEEGLDGGTWGARTVILSPGLQETLPMDGTGLPLTWEPTGSDLVLVQITSQYTREKIRCFTEDDGAFTAPEDALPLLSWGGYFYVEVMGVTATAATTRSTHGTVWTLLGTGQATYLWLEAE